MGLDTRRIGHQTYSRKKREFYFVKHMLNIWMDSGYFLFFNQITNTKNEMNIIYLFARVMDS